MGWLKSIGNIFSTIGTIWNDIAGQIKAAQRRKTIEKNTADASAAVAGLRKSNNDADSGSDSAAE